MKNQINIKKRKAKKSGVPLIKKYKMFKTNLCLYNSVAVDTLEESPVPALEFHLLAVTGLSINLTVLSHKMDH